jgi:thermostable 8-oxoguanine DNA glycosylase
MEHTKANPIVFTPILLCEGDQDRYFRNALTFTEFNYKEDYDRIANTNFKMLSKEAFFKEYVWCVYVSGFRASIVSKKWKALMRAYRPLFDFNRPVACKIDYDEVIKEAMIVFANGRKVAAVVETHKTIDGLGLVDWAEFRDDRLATPELLQRLPFIGKITCYHLARNIGLLDFVKPDVHLVRMAKHWGYADPQTMCEELGEKFDLKPGLVDLVLWYAASTFGTRDIEPNKETTQ